MLLKNSTEIKNFQQIFTLAMISPFSVAEKQKLLESLTIKDKMENLENIMSFYLHHSNFNNRTVQWLISLRICSSSLLEIANFTFASPRYAYPASFQEAGEQTWRMMT